MTTERRIVDEPYDRAGTPGRACLDCQSAWPASEPDDEAHHHASGCKTTVPAACDCYGCQQRGQGTCGCMTCSECLADSATVLPCVDEETNRHLCPMCASNERAARAYDAHAVLGVLLADDFAAAGAT